MNAMQEWAADNFLTIEDCDNVLNADPPTTSLEQRGAIQWAKNIIESTLTEAQEQEIKESNLLADRVDAFDVIDQQTLTLKELGE